MTRVSGVAGAIGPGPRRSWPWTAAALVAAAVVSLPILAVLGSLAHPAWAVWAHLARTQLPELLLNTVALVAAVGLGVLLLGTTLAWLIVTCEFPGRRLFEWALVLPLALPAYVIGFVFLGIFEYAGPLQTALRGWLGPGARLPDLRSGWGVALMMTLVYYPYVYTLARAALAEQAPEFLETARGLGRSRTAILFRVTLASRAPRARRRHGPGVHGGAGGLRHRRDVQLPHADRGGLPRVARDVRSRRRDPARRDPPRAWPPASWRSSASRAGAPGSRTRAARPARPRGFDWRESGRSAPPSLCLGTLGLAFGLPVGQLIVWAIEAARRDSVPEAFLGALLQSLTLGGGAAHPGHGGGRPPRVRDPAPADAARGGGRAPGRTRVCAPGRGDRGGGPPPAGLARPDAGGGHRLPDRCRAGPPPDRVGGRSPLRLSRAVPGRREARASRRASRGSREASTRRPARSAPAEPGRFARSICRWRAAGCSSRARSSSST